MKIGLPLKLGIGVIVLFAIVIAGMMLYPEIRFRWHASRLESENQDDRWKAFAALSRMGGKGHEVIRKYCIARTEFKWGKEVRNVKIKLRTDKYLLKLPVIKYYGSTPEKFGFKIEAINLGKDFRWLSYSLIMGGEAETLIREKKKLCPLERAIFALARIIITPGEKETLALSDRLLIECDIDAPGVYRIQLHTFINDPQEPSVQNKIKSNWICVAVLPREK